MAGNLEYENYQACIKEIATLRNTLMEEIKILERWANDSCAGGWSKHQVDAQRKRADELRRVLIP